MPVQTPPMHVRFVNAAGAPQAPVASHVWTPLPLHWVEPGEHATQALLRQAGVGPEHVDCVCQLPVGSHAWIAAPRHCVSPGPQPPVHAPFTQV
jgi:hypothetical protein